MVGWAAWAWSRDLRLRTIAKGFRILRIVPVAGTVDSGLTPNWLVAALVIAIRQALDFTSPWRILGQVGIRVSMDGKGRYSDNIFVERLWRTVKYEED